MESQSAVVRPHISFRTAGPEDYTNIMSFRNLVYGRTFGQNQDFSIRWTRTDEISSHFLAFDGELLVASLRLTIARDEATFLRVMTFEAPNYLKFPVALLARGCTHPEYEGRGLHSQLRLRALQVCERLQLSSVWGTLQEDSLRLPRLLTLGYQIRAISDTWKDGLVVNLKKVCLISLEGPEAIRSCVNQLQSKNL